MASIRRSRGIRHFVRSHFGLLLGLLGACGGGAEPDAIDLDTVVTGAYVSDAQLVSSTCQPAVGSIALLEWPAEYQWDVRIDRNNGEPGIELPFYFKLTGHAGVDGAADTVCARGINNVRLSQADGFEKIVATEQPSQAACSPASTQFQYRLTRARHDRLESHVVMTLTDLASGCDNCFVGSSCQFKIRYTYELAGSCSEPCSMVSDGDIVEGKLVQKIACHC